MSSRGTVSTLTRATAFDVDDELLWDGDYLATTVAFQSYRSLRRFIARHVVPRADSRIRRLLNSAPEECARRLAGDSRALDAWAVALWSVDIECYANYRLWNCLSRADGQAEARRAVLNRDAMAMEFNVKAPNGALSVAQAQWLLQHATMAVLRHRFGRARALAQGMANAGEAVLGDELIGPSSLSLAGEVLNTGDLQFTADAEVMRDVLVPRPQRCLDVRRLAAAEVDLRRLQKLKALCAGICLRYTWRDGWTVAPSTEPRVDAGVIIKRNRLFTQGRPAFVIFATSNGFCARMVDVPLEVLDECAWKAIDTLRHAYTRYAKQQSRQFDEDGLSSATGLGQVSHRIDYADQFANRSVK